MRTFQKLLASGITALALLSAPALAEPTTVEVGLMAVQFPEQWQQIGVPNDEVNSPRIMATSTDEGEEVLFFLSIVPKDGRTLGNLSSQTRRYITKEMDGVLEYERATTLDGAPAHLFVYEGRSEHSEQGRRKFMRALVSKGNDFYVLHGVADHVPFAAEAGNMEKIVNSVEWK